MGERDHETILALCMILSLVAVFVGCEKKTEVKKTTTTTTTTTPGGSTTRDRHDDGGDLRKKSAPNATVEADAT